MPGNPPLPSDALLVQLPQLFNQKLVGGNIFVVLVRVIKGAYKVTPMIPSIWFLLWSALQLWWVQLRALVHIRRLQLLVLFLQVP